jgi:hypothetical protein
MLAMVLKKKEKEKLRQIMMLKKVTENSFPVFHRNG